MSGIRCHPDMTKQNVFVGLPLVITLSLTTFLITVCQSYCFCCTYKLVSHVHIDKLNSAQLNWTELASSVGLSWVELSWVDKVFIASLSLWTDKKLNSTQLNPAELSWVQLSLSLNRQHNSTQLNWTKLKCSELAENGHTSWVELSWVFRYEQGFSLLGLSSVELLSHQPKPGSIA